MDTNNGQDEKVGSNEISNKNDQADDSFKIFSNEPQEVTEVNSNHQLHINKAPSTLSRSRSVSRNRKRNRSPKRIRSWKSINPFINFMQDFRQRFPDVRSTNILRLGGEEWRNMSSIQKQPYMDAAKAVRLHRQEKLQKEEKRQRRARQQRLQTYKEQQRQKRKQQKQEIFQKLENNANYVHKRNKKIKAVIESKKADGFRKKKDKQYETMHKLDSDTDAEYFDTGTSVASEDLSDTET